MGKVYISKVVVENFRCFKGTEIGLEEDLTLIVGENDSGKSSFLDVFRIIFSVNNKAKKQDKKLEIEEGDFFVRKSEHEKNESDFINEPIRIRIELSNGDVVEYIKKDLNEDPLLCLCKSTDEFREYIQNPDLVNNLSEEKLKKVISQLGGNIGSRSSLETLRKKFSDILEEKKEEIINKEKISVEIDRLDDYLYEYFDFLYLDGKTFYNVDDILYKLYLEESLMGILDEPIKIGEYDKKISEIINGKIENIIKDKEKEINELLLKDIKNFLPEVKRISLLHELDGIEKNISKSIKIKVFLNEDNNDQGIMLTKKGDGTKRRMTLALLKYAEKKDFKKPILYLFDEPDTHLHVRAQYELMSIIEKLKMDNQIVMTTHSPFIINYVLPKKIVLFEKINGETKVEKSFMNERAEDEIRELFRELGIENSDLFFTRKVVLVEGSTDEEALNILYEKLYDRMLYNDLIKIIHIKGCDKAEPFCRIIQEFMPYIKLYVFIDNDIWNNPNHSFRKFIGECKKRNIVLDVISVGEKEFEDAFTDETIKRTIQKIINDIITPDLISEIDKWVLNLRKKLSGDKKTKYSEEIKEFINSIFDRNQVDLSIEKGCILPELAKNCEVSEIPFEVNKLFEKLREE
ncbi:SMC domain protein [Caldicellulosiruptor kronotskyensis 2002]|uniref:SMC domain protein n=1 Tax=Caldicellulosiruptor kronotskyensis (strain DSM 18902 / VKM B-2412 / 2002) TaxID=632348 RepID=E4SCX5_CALK2|nr:AAA family ATPase [Caldicellulosiruptor kronotskyensis]ADQ45991.1 SMC domain protein [Caldicellulosiruptor kronotskyensis 2002]